MGKNFLKLIEEKTEILLTGPKAARENLLSVFGSLSKLIKTHTTNMWVILDSNLNFNPHLNKVIKTSFFHFRNIARVTHFLTQKDTEILIHTFITSCLDFWNYHFTGFIRKLQLVQNASARIQTKTKKMDHISPLLQWVTHCTGLTLLLPTSEIFFHFIFQADD